MKTKKGTIAMATGVGKSKVFILMCIEMLKINSNLRICLVVPTEKLRDENWKKEFSKWGQEDIYSKLDRYCYASISKIKTSYDVIGLDEVHNLTENNAVFLEKNKKAHILGMTATPPEELNKQELLAKYCPIIYSYSLIEGITDGIVLPFKIKIVELSLDSTDKYIIAGSKDKPFKTTELAQHKYLTILINKARYLKNAKLEEFRILHRMRFLYNLKSKTEIAKKIIDKYLINKKSIIFCGSIAQAEELCKNTYHSKTNNKALDRFISGEINQISCVKALNEGINIPFLDAALIVQGSSKKRELIQRIGRCVRYRENALAEIYILSILNTQDQIWTENAITDFPSENIEYTNFKNI